MTLGAVLFRFAAGVSFGECVQTAYSTSRVKTGLSKRSSPDNPSAEHFSRHQEVCMGVSD